MQYDNILVTSKNKEMVSVRKSRGKGKVDVDVGVEVSVDVKARYQNKYRLQNQQTYNRTKNLQHTTQHTCTTHKYSL